MKTFARIYLAITVVSAVIVTWWLGIQTLTLLKPRTPEVVLPTVEVKSVEEVEVEVEQEPLEDSVTPYFELSVEERYVVESVVMGEAGGESLKGQKLVAQCLLNACIKDGLQPSQVRTKYKYSGWNSDVSDSVRSAVEAVFDNGETVVDEPILYFYAPNRVSSRYHESQEFVIEVGGHRFFKEWS